MIVLVTFRHGDFRNEVRRIRTERGLTKTDVANNLDITANNYNNKERGTTPTGTRASFNLHEILTLCKYFHITFGQFVTHTLRKRRTRT